jgi:hypothetical protein
VTPARGIAACGIGYTKIVVRRFTRRPRVCRILREMKVEALRRTGVRQQTLRRARDMLGGHSALVRSFTVHEAELQQWLHGKAAIPAWVFLRALDIVNEKEERGAGPDHPK